MPDGLHCGSCGSQYNLSQISLFIQHKQFGCKNLTSELFADILECMQCSQTFKTPWTLLWHIQQDHKMQLVKHLFKTSDSTCHVNHKGILSCTEQTTEPLDQNGSKDTSDSSMTTISSPTLQITTEASVISVDHTTDSNFYADSDSNCIDIERRLQKNVLEKHSSAFLRTNENVKGSVENSYMPFPRRQSTTSITCILDGTTTTKCCLEMDGDNRNSTRCCLDLNEDVVAEDLSFVENNSIQNENNSIVTSYDDYENRTSDSASYIKRLSDQIESMTSDNITSIEQISEDITDDTVSLPNTSSININNVSTDNVECYDGYAQQTENTIPVHDQPNGPASISYSDGIKYNLTNSLTLTNTTIFSKKGKNKQFICKICDRQFRQKIHLTKHIMSQHTKEKPFKCNLCSYATVEQSHLKVHMRKHTGERPFKCRVCNYQSAQNCTLKHHYLRLHNTNFIICNACSTHFYTESERDKHEKLCDKRTVIIL